jgi:hypothetical protein
MAHGAISRGDKIIRSPARWVSRLFSHAEIRANGNAAWRDTFRRPINLRLTSRRWLSTLAPDPTNKPLTFPSEDPSAPLASRQTSRCPLAGCFGVLPRTIGSCGCARATADQARAAAQSAQQRADQANAAAQRRMGCSKPLATLGRVAKETCCGIIGQVRTYLCVRRRPALEPKFP